MHPLIRITESVARNNLRFFDLRERSSLFALLLAFICAAALPFHATAAAVSGTRVLCSVFPVYSIALELVRGTDIQVDLLLPADLGCPHNYALTPTDLKKMGDADALFCIGLGFEPFVDRIPQSASLTPYFMAKDFSTLPSFGGSQENAHIFTTPKGVSHLATSIAEALTKVFPANTTLVKANEQKFLALVAAYDRDWSAAAERFSGTPVLLAQDSLDYIAQDLHLKILGHIESGDTANLSAKEMLELAALIRNKHPVAILVDSQTSSPAAETLSQETNIPIVPLDTLARGPAFPPEGHAAKVLADNLELLTAGLSEATKNSAEMK